jgi:hypothetical protein
MSVSPKCRSGMVANVGEVRRTCRKRNPAGRRPRVRVTPPRSSCDRVGDRVGDRTSDQPFHQGQHRIAGHDFGACGGERTRTADFYVANVARPRATTCDDAFRPVCFVICIATLVDVRHRFRPARGLCAAWDPRRIPVHWVSEGVFAHSPRRCRTCASAQVWGVRSQLPASRRCMPRPLRRPPCRLSLRTLRLARESVVEADVALDDSLGDEGDAEI